MTKSANYSHKGVLMGSQEPSVRIVPEHVDSDGADAVKVLRTGQLSVDPWQANVLEDWMGRTEEGLSAITSTKRPIAGGWGFGGENAISIEAATLALWGCRSSKRDPNRKMRIG